MEEIFKDIPGYEGMYQVSNLGRVKSLKYNKERILKGAVNSGLYLSVCFCKCNKQKSMNVHQLVAVAFLNHTINGHKLVVDHINDNKLDNTLENLQIVTQRENAYKTQGKGTSIYKGVYWNKNHKRWYSRIAINGKEKYLGSFIDELKASEAYQNKLKEIQKL